jgi:hypothetical protein
MNYKIKTEVETIDAKRATWLLENCHFEFQRDTNTSTAKNWIDFLARQMIKGRFHPTSPLIFAVSKNNKFNYLLNGYHTLKAIVKSDCTFIMVIVTFYVENKKEASVLYTHIDIGKNRTGSQRLTALEIAKELDVKITYIGKATSAIRYIVSGFPNSHAKTMLAIEDEVYFLREWKAEIFFYFDIYKEVTVSEAMKQRVLIAPVLAPSIVVLRYDFDNATTFIKRMMNGAGLDSDSPILKFRDRLIETRRLAGSTNVVTQGHLSRAFAKTWNAFVKGQSMAQLKVGNKEVEKNIILNNTPLDGSKDTFQFMKDYIE